MIKLFMKSVLVALFTILFLGCRQEKGPEKWNIVFILADDLGWNQVGYHGTQYYETPNIDRISAEGISFSNAYSANPVCSPTRASIMTGKNSARLHLTDYIPGSPYPYERLSTPVMVECLPLEELTLAELMKENGYITGHFGKWHLSPDKNYLPGRPFDPASQGFDEVFTSVKPEENADPEADAHHAIEITERTMKFIEKHKDETFFAWVSHHVLHRPIMEKEELIAKYAAKPGSDNPVNNPIMGAMIETMDNGIGQIMDKLNELGLAEKTIVIFYSDNGGLEQLQDQAPFRGGKAMIFEGGIKVPLAIKWPGVIRPGSKNDQLVISDDFFPTLAEILGYEELSEDIDGISLLPVLTGEGALERNALYFHYPHYHHLGYKPAGAVHEGDYKLIEWYVQSISGEGKAYELFNLVEDPGEENDLSGQMPAKVIEMAEKLRQWRKDVGAQEMVLNEAYTPEKSDWRFQDSKY
ncbi:sulfatase [Bacteroidota bacterium]